MDFYRRIQEPICQRIQRLLPIDFSTVRQTVNVACTDRARFRLRIASAPP
ncbi:MAG TPA: hypothetical protein VLZ12_07915 [Verrucomicrobiae bacterium]|nr:hypothetical protein [Verrucomicrobiae bacterium]